MVGSAPTCLALGRSQQLTIIKAMTLQELEKTIALLPPDELAKFRKWFLEFDAGKWDEQLEADVAAGKLDDLAEKALQQHRAGESTGL